MKRNKKEDILLNTDNDDISMLAEIQTDPDEVTAMEFNKEIPVMPLRNMVMFPSVVMPVTIGRPSTLKLINAAYKKKAWKTVLPQNLNQCKKQRCSLRHCHTYSVLTERSSL